MSSDYTGSAAKLREGGYLRLCAAAAGEALRLDPEGLSRLSGSWERLPRDEYLRDGGRYRARRHSCFVQTLEPHPPQAARLEPVPHRPHWQPTAYNALHGGLTRWFEPIEPAVAQAPAWRSLLTHLGQVLARDGAVPTWYIEAHQFRVDTQGGIEIGRAHV